MHGKACDANIAILVNFGYLVKKNSIAELIQSD